MHDLHRDVPGHLRLDRAVDRGPRAVADPFEQSVPAQRFALQLEVGVVLQDPLVQRGQVRRRIDAELVGQDLAGALERGQGVALAARPVERDHQLAPHALSQRVMAEQRFGVADRSRMFAAGQEGFEPVFLGHQPELVEPRGLTGQRGFVGEVGERRTAPQTERLLQDRDGRRRVGRAGLSCVAEQRLEPIGVELVGADLQPVAGRPALDPLGAERLAEMRDVGLQGVPRRLRRFVAPQFVDQGRRRDRVVRTEDQVQQHRALLGATQHDRPVVDVDLERPEHLESHRATVHGRGCVRKGTPCGCVHDGHPGSQPLRSA